MPTLTELIKQAKITYVNENITEANFPLESDGLEPVEVLHFGKDLSVQKAIAEIKKRGLEPARIEHLLQYAIKNPDDKNFLVALGSSCVGSDGDRYSPRLDVDGRNRDLCLFCVDDVWHKDCRFLAFRKYVPSDTQPLARPLENLENEKAILRDKFAMAALSGIIARSEVDGFTLDEDIRYHITLSYQYADIAMDQREKSKQD